jgi:hypothetical protein
VGVILNALPRICPVLTQRRPLVSCRDWRLVEVADCKDALAGQYGPLSAHGLRGQSQKQFSFVIDDMKPSWT